MELPAQGPTDLGAVKLAQSIRAVESNGNFAAKGKSGEYGAYQFMPETWKAWAGKYLGDSNADITNPENQNKVAYAKIKDLKDQGYTPEQVASIWNSGKPDYAGNVGVNSKGVAFDTPKYVASVIDKFQQLKQGQQNGPTLPNPSQVQAPEQKSVGGFIGNIFNSASGVVGGLANALFHPIQTLQGLGSIAAGGAEKLIPGQQADEQSFNNLVDFFKQRYGGVENIKNTIYKDPVGFALDLSTALGAGGAALGVAGKVGKIDSLTRAAGIAGKAAELTNPLEYAGKAASSIAGAGKNVALTSAGMATGKGGNVFRIAEDVGQQGGAAKTAFNLAAAGKDSPEAILAAAEKQYTSLEQAASAEYKAKLAGIKTAEHSLTSESVAPIRQAFDQKLSDLNVVRDAAGNLDFRGSILDGDASAMRRVQQLDEKIAYAEKNPNPVILDNLKRFASDAWKPGKDPLNVITQPIKNTTRNVLNDNVPAYQEMTSKYHEAADTLDEIRGALGIGGRAGQETLMNKIMSSLNENRQNRAAALGKLGGNNFLKERIAGYQLSNLVPGGLAKYAAELGFGGALALTHNPVALLGAIGASPKIMGKFAKSLGITEGAATRIANGVSKITGLKPGEVALILSQSGRLANQ